MRETEQFYFFYEHQFGQWTQRQMTDPDGIGYNCCEQYMMFKKACLFQDSDSADRILNEVVPARQKELGRQVKGYQPDLWNQHKFGIVWYGNYLKFSQHADLRKRLLATGEKTLAEASPLDRVWGVGLAADDERILDTANWTGQNLLGKALMSVRQALAQHEQ
ncbi:NADAR family protein [bacterium]|nr:NADAR family protein [bacterium]